ELDALAEKATLHDNSSGKFAIGDAINNSTAVVTGILGVAVTATAAAVAGTVSTAVGLVFASVGTVLAIRAAVHAHGAVGRIAAIEKYLTSEKAQSIASYAKGQKETKRNRQLGLAVLGAATVAVGIAGIASGGLILGLAGIAVAAAALGVGLWKYFHRRAKRKAEETVAKEMAAGIIEGAREGEPAAKAIFDQHRGDQRAIEAWAQHQFTEKRHHTAVDLVNMLDSEVPSERFNSETIVQSLGLAPDDIRQAALRDQAEAIGLVERKLASW
ncbi:MAG: hypothetical protein Q8M03_01935, partial [Legionella sp.]|nr:hypothetical protein [Legionella sp.]